MGNEPLAFADRQLTVGTIRRVRSFMQSTMKSFDVRGRVLQASSSCCGRLLEVQMLQEGGRFAKERGHAVAGPTAAIEPPWGHVGSQHVTTRRDAVLGTRDLSVALVCRTCPGRGPKICRLLGFFPCVPCA